MKSLPEQELRSARNMLERLLLANEENAIERVLDAHSSIADHEELVADLIYNDYLVREERGESPRVQEYVDRFPDHEARILRLFEIHATLDSQQHLSRLDSDSAPMTRLLSPGDMVGPFELLSSLGSGGRGFVFKARQVELDRIVALKILKVTAVDEREVARFLAEAKATAKLLHPSIVQVYESDVYENLPYIALEYLSGGTLEERLSGGPLSANEAAELIAVLAEAVQYAHDQGVVHRDLKPSNILLTSTGAPKIADFGLAKRSHVPTSGAPQSLTETGTVLGTPSYMAPEQAEGRNRDVGPATDVYGLGVVLYQLITGAVPFFGESTLDILQSICTMEPVAPSLRNPKVPRDLETICLKCLEKDPASRYASASDLGNDLNRFLTGHSILARPSSAAQRFTKLARRHPLTTTLIAGLVVSLIVVFAVISWQWNQAAINARTQAQLRSATEDALYSNQLALAHQEIKSSESLRALEILFSTDPRRRHWEWDYLKQSCGTYATLATLGPDTRRCVLSSDGALLVVVKGRWGTDEPGELAVIDTQSRKLLFKKSSTFGPIMDASISPDGNTIATVETRFAGEGGLLAFYQARTGELKKTIPQPSNGLFAVAFHPVLPKIAMATEHNTVELWDLDTEQRVLELRGHRGRCYRIAFSPTGAQLASCSGDATVRLWDTESGELDSVLHAQRDLMKVAYTPDGRYVVANGVEQALLFWDRLENPPRRNKVHLAGDDPLSYDFSVSQQGRYVMAFGDGGKRLLAYDASLGRLHFQPAGTLNRPYWLACHPHQGRLYVVDADGNVLESSTRPANPYRRFVTAGATAFDLNDQRELVAIAAGMNRVLPERRDFRCRLLPLSKTDGEIRFFEGAPASATAVALSPDGSILACGCEDGTLLQWSTDSGELLVKSAFHQGNISHLRFSEDSGRLTSVCSDGWVARWKGAVATPSSTLRLPTSSVHTTVSSRDGNRLLVADNDGLVALYDLDPGRQVEDDEDVQSSVVAPLWQANYTYGAVRAVALSPDLMFAAISDDDSIDLWSIDASKKSPIWSATMPATSATDLAFHPDGLRLAVVEGWIGRVTLFDSTNGQNVLELATRSGNERSSVAFSLDGKQLLAMLGGELYVWRSSSVPTKTEPFSDAQTTKSPPANHFQWHVNTDYFSGTQTAKTRLRTDFQWHVTQATEQVYGGMPFGAEFHAQRAIDILDHHKEKLEGMPAFELLELHAKCLLGMSMCELGQFEQGKELLEEVIASCPEEYEKLHTITLLLVTYPGPSPVSSELIHETADSALQLNPSNSTALATSALAHLKSGENVPASNLIDRATETMTASDGLVHFPLAVIAARSENPQEANRQLALGTAWMESSSSNQPIHRQLHRWAAKELDQPQQSD